MLAWIHQALASEHELLHNLIGPDSGIFLRTNLNYLLIVTADSEYIATSQNMSSSALLASTSLSASTRQLSQGNMSLSTLLTVGGAAGSGVTNLVRVLNITFDGICKPFKVCFHDGERLILIQHNRLE